MATILQSKLGTVSTATTCTAAFSSNLSSGSKIVAFVVEDININFFPTTVKDTAGNSLVNVAQILFPSSTGGLSCWVLDTPAGDVGATTTITATLSGNFGCVVGIMEISGLATGTTAAAIIDGTYGTNSGTASPATSGTYSDSSSGELLIAAVGDPGNNGTYTLTGYTQIVQTAANTAAQLALGQKNSSGGSESFSWAQSVSGDWGSLLFAFKNAPVSTSIVLPSGLPWQTPLAGSFGPNRPFAQDAPLVSFPQPAAPSAALPWVPPLRRRLPLVRPSTASRTPVPGPGAVSQPLPSPVSHTRRNPRLYRHPAPLAQAAPAPGAVSQPLPALQPQLPKRNWVLFRRPAQHPVTGLGGISQPLPAIQPMLPRKLRWYPRGRLSAQVPGPGAVSQPLPAIEPQRPRRVLPPPRRRLDNQPVPTGGVSQPLPALQPQRPLRLYWKPGRRPGAALSSAQAAPVSPSRSRPRVFPRLRSQAMAAPPPPAVVAPAAPAPTAGRSRKVLRGPRARVAPSVPGPTVAAIVIPPAPAGGRTARFMLFARRRLAVQRSSGGVSQPLPAISQPARRLPPRRPLRAQQVPQAAPEIPGVQQMLPRKLRLRRPVQPQQIAPAPRPPAVSRPPARRVLVPFRRARPGSAAQPVFIPPAVPAPIAYRRRVWQWFLRKRRGDVVPGPTTVPPSHPAGEWEVGGREDRWQVKPLRAQWGAEAASSRWGILALPAQWVTTAISGRWQLEMGSFEPIAAISQENVPVTWTSNLAGTVVVPDGSTGNSVMAVQFAFPVSSGNPLAPAEPSTWYPASWLAGQTSRGFVAECPVGPSTTGPTLTAGQKYDVWSQVNTGTNATVEKFAGVLTVY